jgi:hypothetical protein
VAWDRKLIYDPRGWIKELEVAGFNPQIFYLKSRAGATST